MVDFFVPTLRAAWRCSPSPRTDSMRACNKAVVGPVSNERALWGKWRLLCGVGGPGHSSAAELTGLWTQVAKVAR